jgi:hypothetical protein
MERAKGLAADLESSSAAGMISQVGPVQIHHLKGRAVVLNESAGAGTAVTTPIRLSTNATRPYTDFTYSPSAATVPMSWQYHTIASDRISFYIIVLMDAKLLPVISSLRWVVPVECLGGQG